MTTEICVDLLSELVAVWKDELARVGSKVPPHADANAIGRDYFNVLFKSVAARPRQSWFSNELQRRALPRVLQTGLERFVEDCRLGADLNPYLSKSWRKGDEHDWLLNDWGIKHFHLGVPTARGVVPRTRGLLFAWVGTDDIYLIDVLSHQAFAARSIIEIVAQNWPQLVEPFVLKGITPPSEGGWSDDERDTLRRKGVMPILHFGGKAYAGPGGGFATTGISNRATHWLQTARRRITAMEAEARSRAVDLAAQVELETGKQPSKICANLIVQNGKLGYRYSYEP